MNDFSIPVSEYADGFNRHTTTKETIHFDTGVAGDHIACLTRICSELPFAPRPVSYCLTTKSFNYSTLSTIIETIVLGTNICVAPLQQPVALV